MTSGKLRIFKRPILRKPRLLMGLSGWMDGGNVSSGTLNWLIEKLDAEEFAEIDHRGFYIWNFPGSMEITALFRPHTRIKNGLIKSIEVPTNKFYFSEQNNLILFLGKEPNLQWQEFAECVFSLCSEFGVKSIYFIGSVAGLVPHTREPRIFSSISDSQLKEKLEKYGVKFTDYEGPASIVTYMTISADKQDLNMATLVATIPAYVQGNNPRCIEAVIRRLVAILGLKVELDDLRTVSDEFEKKLSEVVAEQEELAESVTKLEEDYDNEIFDSEMGDLKNWLQQQGIRLD